MKLHSSILRARRGIGILAAAVLVASLAACSAGGDSPGSTPSTSTVLNLRYAAPSPSLNPWTQTPLLLMEAMYDSLTRIDSTGEVVPSLATEWSYTDPTTLRMSLREGVTFTDGTEFNADAVITNLEYGRDESTSGAAATLRGIESIIKIDDSTIEINLSTPDPDLPANMAGQASFMVSPAALIDPTALLLGSNGTGPYLLDTAATVAGQKYVTKRNAAYWDADTFPFSSVVMNIISDNTAATNALKTGQLSVLSLSPGASTEGLDMFYGAPTRIEGIALFDIDGTIQPALADLRVRQALNYAVDRDAIIGSVYGDIAEVNPSVPATVTNSGWTAELQNTYSYDPDKAKALLSEAGYPDGFSMEVLSTPAADGLLQPIAGYLREVGIDVTIEDHTTDLLDQLNSGTWAAGNFSFTLSGNTFSDIRSTMSSESFFNVMKIDDPKLTELMAAAAASGSEADNAALLQYATEQAWYVLPAVSPSPLAYDPEAVKITQGDAPILHLYFLQAPS